MASRIGVDIGGTFTDFIVYDEAGNKVIIDKIPTTPETPEKAVVDVIKRNLSKEDLQKVDFFLHGTTVGLNALLERKGSKVGLLCTKGFRDILEIRRGDRDEMYNLFWQPPPPLVPRFLRVEIEERLHADGTITESSHGTTNVIDILSNGWKMRTSGSGLNGSGGEWVWLAMSHNPFKYATAR